jgi:C-terminal processing protease CtpA/Prc
MDDRCFSATDIFLGALKGLPNVTLAGRPSGGGSGFKQSFTLPRSRIEVRCASMASFAPDGRLYDLHGIEPDASLGPEPAYFLESGGDAMLAKAREMALR